MKKIFNFRLMPAICLSMILAVMLVYFSFLDNRFSTHNVTTVISFFAVVMIITFILFRNKIVSIIKSNYIYAIIIITMFTITLGLGYVTMSRYDSLESYYGADVTAHVTDVSNVSYGKVVELDHVMINGDNIPYNINLYLYSNLDIEIGDDVSLVADVKITSLYTDSINVSSYVNNTPYSIHYPTSVTITTGSKTINEYIRTFVKDRLYSNMGATESSIVYAMLFGQKREVPTDVYSMFSISGSAHILAVSGLHISVFVAAISFVLDRLKVSKKTSFIVTLLIILGYASLCDFTASVMRAGVMSLVMIFGRLMFRKYDSLSSLSFAAIIYLMLQPFSIFTIGFQLSYLCVFSIITLSPYMQMLFDKIRCPKVLSQGIAISISVNLVLFPISANVFESVSMIGIISNIVILPIFNVVYVSALICIILSILPFMVFMLKLVELMVVLITKIVEIFSYISILNFTVFHISYIVMFIIILSLLILKYSLVRDMVRRVSVVVLVIVSTIIIGYDLTPTRYSGINMMIDYQYSSNVALYSLNDKIVLVGADIKEKDLARLLKKRKISTIDIVIAFDIEDRDYDYRVFEKYGSSKIMVNVDVVDNTLDNMDAIKSSNHIDNIFTYKPIIKGDKILALDIYVHGSNILHLNNDISSSEWTYVANSITKDYEYTVTTGCKVSIDDYTDKNLGKIVSHGYVVDYYDTVIHMENNYFYDVIIKKGI